MGERRFYDHDDQAVRVQGLSLGRGGEGHVLPIPGSDEVAKILLEHRRTREREEKLLEMTRNPPRFAHAQDANGDPVLAWPRRVLYRNRGGSGFLGYAMVRVDGFYELKDLLSNHNRVRAGVKGLHWGHQIRLARNLAHVVDVLHAKGYRFGELNDQNILAKTTGSVCIIDCDSMQVPRTGGGFYGCTVARQEFTAPEIHRAGGAGRFTGDRLHGDRFALGVLVFMLLMNKTMPYQARGRLVDGLESIRDKITAGHYPYPKPRRNVCEPPPYAPPYDAIPPSVQELFRRCFERAHAELGLRPSAGDWRKELQRVEAIGYNKCKRRSSHVYSSPLTRCPWCCAANDPYMAGPIAARRIHGARTIWPSSSSRAPARRRKSRVRLLPRIGKWRRALVP